MHIKNKCQICQKLAYRLRDNAFLEFCVLLLITPTSEIMSSWRRADILPHSIIERSLSEMDIAPNETHETEIEIVNLIQ